MKTCVQTLLRTITHSTSPFHAAKEAVTQLEESGFTPLVWEQPWDLKPGGCYYVCPFGTTVLAFRINRTFSAGTPMRIAAAHIDQPGLRIKAHPEITSSNCMRLNTEVYGGAIYHTWTDRPLSASGRVVLKSRDVFHPDTRLLDFKRPLFVIPNLAIHVNRKVNDGIALNPQTDLMPVAGCGYGLSEHFFIQAIADELQVSPGDILSYELGVYNAEPGTLAGLKGDLLLAPRLDNLTSMQACLTGLMQSSRPEGLDLIALFDHEEIGSRSKNGAMGNLLPFVLERICQTLGLDRANYCTALAGSYLLSLDVAHAVHPGHPEKADLTSGMNLNEGIAIKCTDRQNYSTDSEMAGILLQLADRCQIPCRQNFPRSDSAVGGTVGPMLSASLAMRSADIGIPIYAMHSAMETAGAWDQYYLEQFMKGYFSES